MVNRPGPDRRRACGDGEAARCRRTPGRGARCCVVRCCRRPGRSRSRRAEPEALGDQLVAYRRDLVGFRHPRVRGFGSHHRGTHREVPDEERPVECGVELGERSRRSSPGRSSQNGTASSMASRGTCSTVTSASITYSRCSGVSAGASAYPQFAITTVDTPYCEHGVRNGSQRLVGVEMRAGVDPTGREHEAASVDLVGAGSGPPRRARSGRRRRRRRPRSPPPVPSITVAPRTTRS